MKYILTFSALLTLSLCFSSCEKDYVCYCEESTYVDGNKRTYTDYKYDIHALKKDAEKQCVPYETEEVYLNQPAKVYHSCGLK